ncbi:hypothetical protein GC101_28435 [Paenibacillus sp. LMG 31459]|uniref:YlbF family regulator n=1 Tax=Paenibacillus phytohabitans TaxID=2654978 RepID=A0ABX1YP07_9BACL|nr:hypothetical protein [Paenibacillus phytohabitans]NOU82797.1 hypothetical protein [Paenibacillus phytohabitans]
MGMLLRIAQRMVLKSQEIEAIREGRRPLFSEIEKNEQQIFQKHYEMEFMRLESMYLKQEQIQELKNELGVYDMPVYQQQLDCLEAITNQCISSILKRLFEGGCGQELKKRGLVGE